MEFEDEHNEEHEEEEEQEEGVTIPPQPAGYESVLRNSSKLTLNPRPANVGPNANAVEIPMGGGGAASAGRGGGGKSRAQGGDGNMVTVRYRECLKNHAVNIGGNAVDGCGEFMPAGEEGTLDALRCAACSCHRNFHKKVVEGGELPGAPIGAGVMVGGGSGGGGGGALYPQFTSYYRTSLPPPGYLPLAAMPATPTSAQHHHHQRHQNRSPFLPSAPVGMHNRDDLDDYPSSSGGGGGNHTGGSKKRFRTKFSQEQKDKMLAFAETLGWRIQKHDDAAVNKFCEDNQVRRQVFKVWMHNNKSTLGNKP